VPSTPVPRVIVSVLLPEALGGITSTISSRAVSGSITTVNVSPVARVIPPRSAVAELTTIVVALEFSAEVRLLSWEVEEYFLTVIF
jgi:hypothetical protein